MSNRECNRFIGVDGESTTVNGDHRYILLANSTGQFIWDAKGLSTVRCLEFLLDMPKPATYMAFGWNYDANMILGDLDTRTLIQLWTGGIVKWKTYIIEWIPSKWFSVKSGNRRTKVNDAFGFFQSSFVNALRKWDIEPSAGIEEMKAERSNFTPEMKRQIIEYCVSECRDLVTLMDELEMALLSVDLRLSTWVGAGSIASALLKREGVKFFHESDSEFGEAVYTAIRHAYFGGRSELFMQGSFPKVWDYDISSAYPSEAITQPSMCGGVWKRRKRYCDHPYAIWRCEWNTGDDSIIQPFPFRDKQKNIQYPSRGAGWYHAKEVAAAKRIAKIRVVEGYTYHPSSAKKPFDFIPSMYEFRKELKREGHAGEKVIKLGLNAIYGKLAQGFGFRGRNPPFQSYYWAGAITAGTRARVLDIAALAPDDLIMTATDGIFFRSDPKPEGVYDGLGGLELTTFDDMFVAQPGVYAATDTDSGERIGRSRGFFSREIDYGDLERGFHTVGPTYCGSYNANRFVGIGSALVTNSLSKWRKWHEYERRLSLYPSRKFLRENGTANPLRHYSPKMPEDAFSERYTPKTRGTPIDGAALDTLVAQIQGAEQPMRDY